MEKKNQKAVDALNNLLEINNDRIEGYDKAAQEIKETDLKILFSKFSETSYNCKQALTAEIQKLGGTPVEGTRSSGKMYRVWMDVKAALTKKDRKAILSSCEFGEDIAVKNYEAALKNSNISSEAHTMISNQYTLIRADHDKIKNLRNSFVRV